MGGGGGVASDVMPGEVLWRFIEDIWFQPDASGKRVVQEAAFVGEVSLVRASLVTQFQVDTAKNGRFIKHGIAQLKADEIRNDTKGDFRTDTDPDWPPNAHVIFIRKSGGKNLALKHSEVSVLTDLANRQPLLRPPKP
jgi:hypothetical protein